MGGYNIPLVISVTSLKVACLFEDSDHVLRFPFTRDVDQLSCKTSATLGDSNNPVDELPKEISQVRSILIEEN